MIYVYKLKLESVAPLRGAGYVEAIKAAAIHEDSSRLWLRRRDWNRIQRAAGRHDHVRRIGLGDVVHAALAPIARAIDRISGTRLATCSACERRRQKLNNLPKIVMVTLLTLFFKRRKTT